MEEGERWTSKDRERQREREREGGREGQKTNRERGREGQRGVGEERLVDSDRSEQELKRRDKLEIEARVEGG